MKYQTLLISGKDIEGVSDSANTMLRASDRSLTVVCMLRKTVAFGLTSILNTVFVNVYFKMIRLDMRCLCGH